MDIIVIYRLLHPTIMQFTFFSATHETFSKIDHILGHKKSLNTSNKIEITPCIISNYNIIKLEINNKRKNRKYSNTLRLNNIFKEIREEIKKFLETNKNENTTYQKLWDTAKPVLTGKFKATNATFKKQISQINKLMMHLMLQ
jgi:uncharacterized membrane-anchored protein YjiN (DUF445 family)